MYELIDCFRTMLAIERNTLSGELQLRYNALIRTFYLLEADNQNLVKAMREFFDAVKEEIEREE